MTRRVRVVGPGRAGGSFARALGLAGWEVELRPRASDPATATNGTDLLLLCVPDPAVAAVAASVRPSPTTVVAHCAASLDLGVLDAHPRRASIHPLVSMPDAVIGAERLRGAWFATAGDPFVHEVVDALGGRRVEVADTDRVRYHAAAAVASNHLVALLGQVDRLARSVGVPLEAFLALAAGGVASVAEVGPAAALTGPVARGDRATVARHLAELPEEERRAYAALAERAAALVGRQEEFADLLGEPPADGRS